MYTFNKYQNIYQWDIPDYYVCADVIVVIAKLQFGGLQEGLKTELLQLDWSTNP